MPDLATVVISGITYNGTWSMMYDQGFIVETDELRFIANFKYTVKQEELENVARIGSATYEAFNNQCNATMVGIVQYRNN
jgi:hypothetical protein